MTIETEEKSVLRSTCSAGLQPGILERSASMWCPVCCRRVEMVTPELAAKIAGVSPRTIHRWVEERNIHFVEARDRPLFICPRSLSDLS